MGFGNFRNRILIGVILIIILWQSSKIWFPLSHMRSKSNQVTDENLSSKLNQNTKAAQRIEITVFYEALCPDSRSFFVKQLLPTFEKLPESVLVKSIPYGKAKTTKTEEGFTFECQHGPVECKANMIHACSIEVIKDAKQQLQYLTCMIQNNYEPQEIMKSCAKSMDIDYKPIENCYSTIGPKLLAKYGEITEANKKQLDFIPTISLNQDFSNQPAILKNLLKQVCLLFEIPPEGCF